MIPMPIFFRSRRRVLYMAHKDREIFSDKGRNQQLAVVSLDKYAEG